MYMSRNSGRERRVLWSVRVTRARAFVERRRRHRRRRRRRRRSSDGDASRVVFRPRALRSSAPRRERRRAKQLERRRHWRRRGDARCRARRRRRRIARVRARQRAGEHAKRGARGVGVDVDVVRCDGAAREGAPTRGEASVGETGDSGRHRGTVRRGCV